jgi:hypothetical protein
MPDKPPLHFSTGTSIADIVHAWLRQTCSNLKCDLFRCNVIAFVIMIVETTLSL